MPLALTTEQRELIRSAAHPLPRDRRPAFLERVSRLLAGQHQCSNAAVLRAVQQAQAETLGVTMPEPDYRFPG
jgi:hypothetical protein